MVQRYYRIFFGLSFSLIYFTSGYAASPVSLSHTPFSEVKHKFHVRAPGMLRAGQSDGNDLQLLHQHTDGNQVTHARMQQLYAGFPVFGGYAVLHSMQSARQMWDSHSSNNHAVSMNGVVYEGLAAELGRPEANFVKNGQNALQYFKSQFSHEHLSDADGHVQPLVYIDEHHQAHWAYKVSVLIVNETQIPERPTAIVDAKTFQPFVQWNDIKKARIPAKGAGFGGNVHVGQRQFGSDLPFLDITRSDVTGICYMENSHVKVVDMMHRFEGRNQTMHFVCNNSRRQGDNSFFTGYKGNGYDRVNGGFSPSNDALYAGSVIYDMYKNWYGMHPLEENGRPKKMLMRVHYGLKFDNAFWDGEQMTFGDGGMAFYPLVSLGVGAHEISHGFTQQHSDLAYFGQSGGMNESFSDMAAQAAEYYATGANNWKIGYEVVKETSGMKAFRFMDNPRQDGVSIDSADQYTQNMDVHHTSGVYNRLFYLLASTPNWDVRKAFQVMLTANADYWTPTSSFDDGACGIIDAAKSFDYSVADVKQALDQVNVHYADCYNANDDQAG